ncbi:hypothetical protein J6590_033200 [Homalodisca vitripennis]|nr:hypothetical protein J6590_033200 [Homalodisca vitripennis]
MYNLRGPGEATGWRRLRRVMTPINISNGASESVAVKVVVSRLRCPNSHGVRPQYLGYSHLARQAGRLLTSSNENVRKHSDKVEQQSQTPVRPESSLEQIALKGHGGCGSVTMVYIDSTGCAGLPRAACAAVVQRQRESESSIISYRLQQVMAANETFQPLLAEDMKVYSADTSYRLLAIHL